MYKRGTAELICIFRGTKNIKKKARRLVAVLAKSTDSSTEVYKLAAKLLAGEVGVALFS